MFWEKWIPEKYLIKSSVCGIEVLITDHGLKFFTTVLKNQGNKLSIAHQSVSEQKPNLPDKAKKNKLPLILCITGKGLINKKISLGENQEVKLEEILAQNLPTVSADEFYIQLHMQDNGQGYLSVIRKAQLDSILALFKAQQNEVADIIIGPAFISGISPLVSNFTTIITNAYSIELVNNYVDVITERESPENFDVELDGLSLDKTNLLGFSAAFIYLTGAFENYLSDTVLGLYKNKHLQSNKLKVLLYFFVIAAFLICLLNFFIFNNYFSKSKKLETELNIYQGKYEQINELLDNYEKQKNLIEQAGVLNSSNISKFADKIAATVPEEVVLVDFIFNPVKEDTEEDSLVNFKANTIIIKGNCNRSLIINEWLNVLKSQNFIKDINLEKFSFNNEGSQPNFELKIITE